MLANPLMLSLARVEYQGKSPDNLTLFGNHRSIERYLLDEFVPTVYAGDSEQAKRWLGHLAWDNYKQYMYSQQTLKQALEHTQETTKEANRTGNSDTPVLAWWQIRYLAGRWRWLGTGLRVTVLCSVAVALGIWVLAQHGYWRHGAHSSSPNFTALLLGGPVGRLIRPTMHTLAMAGKKWLGPDFTKVPHGVDAIFFVLLVMILTAALFMIIAVLGDWVSGSVPVRLHIRAMKTLGQALRACSYVFTFAAGIALLLLLPAHWPVSAAAFFGSRATWITLLAVSLLGLISVPKSFTEPSDTSGSVSPGDSLRLDRQADAFVTVSKRSAVSAAVWLFCGPHIAAAYAVYAITATVVALALGGQVRFASRSYTDARIWLVLLGWAPWRMMGFLADARRRGVLRQVGAAYQFRHTRLLEQVPEWRASPSLADEWKSRLGRWRQQIVEIVDGIRKDSASRRQVAHANPDAFPPGFDKALGDLLDGLRRSEEQRVRDAKRDLLDSYQTLKNTDPAAPVADPARVLAEVANELPWDQALRMTKETVDAYRHRAQTHPNTFRPGFGYSLRDLADRLWRYWPEESFNVQKKAVAVWRQLADEDPDRFLVTLTSSLDVLVARARELGRQEDELAATRDALDAYRRRAKRIAEIRRQIAEADLAGFLQPRQEPAPAGSASGRARSEERKTALSAARKAAAACGKLAESYPPAFLPDLAEAAQGLGVELNAAGRRREARILEDEADRLRSRYRRPADTTHRKAREVQPLDRMNDLALQLWKLGNQQGALDAGRIRHDLAPQSREGAAAAKRRRASPVRLLARLREELARLREETEVWRWRNDVGHWRRTLQKSRPDDWRWEFLAVALEKHSDALDTLFFWRLTRVKDVADARIKDVADAWIQAVDVQQEAVKIYGNIYKLNVSYGYDLAESLNTLARLETFSHPEEAAYTKGKADEVLADLRARSRPQPAPTEPGPARSRDTSKAPETGSTEHATHRDLFISSKRG